MPISCIRTSQVFFQVFDTLIFKTQYMGSVLALFRVSILECKMKQVDEDLEQHTLPVLATTQINMTYSNLDIKSHREDWIKVDPANIPNSMCYKKAIILFSIVYPRFSEVFNWCHMANLIVLGYQWYQFFTGQMGANSLTTQFVVVHGNLFNLNVCTAGYITAPLIQSQIFNVFK